jgi:imidazolonepropionase-like amidohydrolase
MLEQAGLSRYQILSLATRVPGEFVNRYAPGAAPAGTVTVGSRADLVMTDANPLEDLATLERPAGVTANGRWYDAAELKALIEGVASKYRQ